MLSRQCDLSIVSCAADPGMEGAKALAQSLFGVSNRWGKMPVTVYPHDYIKEQPMTNYDMAPASAGGVGPGRTYK